MIGPTSGVEEADIKFTDVNIFPDPVVEDSKVRFILKEKSKVQFYLCDALERLIENSPTIIYEPGDHFLPVDWEKFDNPGFYFLSIKFDNTLISKKIILIK